MLKTIVFVDGQNFKKNLQTFAFRAASLDKNQIITSPQASPEYRLDEKHFQWQKFFQGIVEKFDIIANQKHRLIRVCWYNAERVTPYWRSEKAIKSILAKNIGNLPDLTGEIIERLAHEWYDNERSNFYNCKDKVYDPIQLQCDFLEFKYCGQYDIKPYEPYRLTKDCDGSYFYQGTRRGEKGVDVGIAVDMVAKMPNYDVAILVSGDADFFPVARYIKDNLRQVYQFSIASGIPPKIRYLSPALKGIADAFEFYDELELLEKYLDRSSGIPSIILATIDQRISYLKSLKR